MVTARLHLKVYFISGLECEYRVLSEQVPRSLTCYDDQWFSLTLEDLNSLLWPSKILHYACSLVHAKC